MYVCRRKIHKECRLVVFSLTINQCPERLLNISGQDPNVSKTNPGSTLISCFKSFVIFKTKNILNIPPKHVDHFPESLGFGPLISRTRPHHYL